MSLPPSYEDSKNYFEDVLVFLKQYQWIYNYPNTDILINNILNHFPLHSVDYFHEMTNTDINLLAAGVINVINYFNCNL